ncbi:MAG: D-alanyl-D-alanine carboxypeptidase family protein [Ruminococcus sp.]
MKRKPKKQLQFVYIIVALAFLICIILVVDSAIRMITRANVTYVVSDGSFSTETNSNGIPEATDKPTEATKKNNNKNKDEEPTSTTQPVDPNYDTITLSDSDLHNGALVMVSNTCPYSGKTDFTDFSTLYDTCLKFRTETLTFQPEMRNPMVELFDAYQASQGAVNLQIHSTSITNTDYDSLYTNVLSERSSGYSFDIGLITSTGEVVPYLTKRNEWMVANCWYYGFILRYPDDKTSITGVDYMPHHFRYVGLPHSMIMYENNYCLEEYLDYVKSYTVDNPLTYTSGDIIYEIYYYAASTTGSTEVKIPKKNSYSISGNNTDGFIITTQHSASEVSSQDTTKNTTESTTEE